MQRNRTLQEIKQSDILKMSELAELCGVRNSTLKYYSELGLLSFKQKGKHLTRYYSAMKTSQRIKAIIKMREQRKTIPEIVSYFRGK